MVGGAERRGSGQHCHGTKLDAIWHIDRLPLPMVSKEKRAEPQLLLLRRIAHTDDVIVLVKTSSASTLPSETIAGTGGKAAA